MRKYYKEKKLKKNYLENKLQFTSNEGGLSMGSLLEVENLCVDYITENGYVEQ